MEPQFKIGMPDVQNDPSPSDLYGTWKNYATNNIPCKQSEHKTAVCEQSFDTQLYCLIIKKIASFEQSSLPNFLLCQSARRLSSF